MNLIERKKFQPGEIFTVDSVFVVLRGNLDFFVTAVVKSEILKNFRDVPWLTLGPGQIYGVSQAAFGGGVFQWGVICDGKFVARSECEIAVFRDFAKFLSSQPEMDFAMAYLAKSERDLDLEISNRHHKLLGAVDEFRSDNAFIPKMLEIARQHRSRILEIPVLTAVAAYGKNLREKERLNGSITLQNIKYHF